MKDTAQEIAVMLLGAIAIGGALAAFGSAMEGSTDVSYIASGIGTAALAALDHMVGIFG